MNIYIILFVAWLDYWSMQKKYLDVMMLLSVLKRTGLTKVSVLMFENYLPLFNRSDSDYMFNAIFNNISVI